MRRLWVSVSLQSQSDWHIYRRWSVPLSPSPLLPSFRSPAAVALAVAWQAGKLCISALPSDIIARLMQQATARIMHDSSRGGRGVEEGSERGIEGSGGKTSVCMAVRQLSCQRTHHISTALPARIPLLLFPPAIISYSHYSPQPLPSVCHLCALKQTNSKIFVC